jgi:glutamyl/glutaminyl-tRNA synthetase
MGTALKALAEKLDVKIRALVMPARCACTGVKIGPSLYDLMAVLGRDRVLERFDAALARMGESNKTGEE